MKWVAIIAAGYALAVWAYPILLGLTILAALGWVVWESAV